MPSKCRISLTQVDFHDYQPRWPLMLYYGRISTASQPVDLWSGDVRYDGLQL